MTPSEDPRPFNLVLSDWLSRHGHTRENGGAPFGWSRATLFRRLSDDREPPDGPMARSHMTMIDERAATCSRSP